MRSNRRFLTIAGAALILSSPLLGAQSALPSLEPDPRAAGYGERVRAPACPWEDLAEAAIWASGGEMTSALRNTLRGAVAELAAALPAGTVGSGDSRERGDFVLGYMHRKFLKSYSPLQTRVDTLITGGQFNCVSSAVMYTILAVSAGLEVRGVMTKDHAFVRLRTSPPAAAGTGSEWIDVETTNPYGFDPGNRREFHDDFGNLTGFAYVPARNYRDRGEISREELLSLILTNRMSILESQRRYREALPLALDRAAFLAGRQDSSPSPLFPNPAEHLLDRLINYGASLVQGGQETEALRWTAQVESRYPDPRWQDLNYTALHNLLVKETRAGRLPSARETLDRYAPRLNPPDHEKLETLLLDAELVKLSGEVKTVPRAEAALETLHKAETRNLLPPARIGELRTFLLLKAGELRAAEAGWAAAITYLETLAAPYRPNPQVDEQLRRFQANRAADLHNAFATAYNRRNYEEARQLLQNALEEYPNNRQLLQDRSLLEKTR